MKKQIINVVKAQRVIKAGRQEKYNLKESIQYRLFDILAPIIYEMRWLSQCIDYSKLEYVQNK